MIKKLIEIAGTDEVLIAGHRGASAYAPENTISSFRKAMELGANMLEIDIQVTADRKIIAFHDDELGRTCTGKGLVSELDYVDILKEDAGGYFSEMFKGEKVPLVEDILKILNKQAYLLIEIKPIEIPYDEFVPQLIALLKKYNYSRYSIFASFDYNVLKYISELDRKFILAALKIPDDNTPVKTLQENLKISAYICSINELNEDISHESEKCGVFNGVYGVETTDDFQKAMRLGVKAIGTDRPDKINSLLNSL